MGFREGRENWVREQPCPFYRRPVPSETALASNKYLKSPAYLKGWNKGALRKNIWRTMVNPAIIVAISFVGTGAFALLAMEVAL